MPPAQTPHKKGLPGQFGAGPAESSPVEMGSAGLLSCKYCHRIGFSPSRRRRNWTPPAYFHASSAAGTDSSPRGDGGGRAATRKPPARPPLSRGRADPPAFACSRTRSSTRSPTPTPGVEPTSRGGAVRSRREQRGGGRWRGGSKRSRFVTGAPLGGKTPQSDERGPGTTVPRHETGRRHLGAVPSGDDPC